MCIGFSWLEREAGPGEAMFKSIEDQKAKEVASRNLIQLLGERSVAASRRDRWKEKGMSSEGRPN